MTPARDPKGGNRGNRRIQYEYMVPLFLAIIELGILNPPQCLPAQHGVLFFVQFVFARTSSGISADVRESDRGERDSSLSGGRPPEIPENVAL